MRKVVLVLGGARSGKSTFALKQAGRTEGNKAFVATAQAFDDEMRIRIEQHKKERGPDWITFEEPLRIAKVIKDVRTSCKIILVDCLTLWLSNIMHSGRDFVEETDQLMETLLSESPCSLFIVSNEVGMGLVPETEIGRVYRDNLGILNRKVAAAATEVYFMTAGLALKIKEEI